MGTSTAPSSATSGATPEATAEATPATDRLERIAFAAWPAAEVKVHGGMRLRATGGESRRMNSAAFLAPDPPCDEAIGAAEAFYAERGLAPCFQIGPAAPEGLDAALAARGYSVEAHTIVETAPLDLLRGDAGGARILDAPDEAWIEIEVTRGRFAPIRETFLGAMASLGTRAGFGVAERLAACLAVCDDGVLVLAAMRTLPEARRRGLARALVHAAAEWGHARGATLAFLQVEEDNAPALALYASLGFTPRYAYHYRIKPRNMGET